MQTSTSVPDLLASAVRITAVSTCAPDTGANAHLDTGTAPTATRASVRALYGLFCYSAALDPTVGHTMDRRLTTTYITVFPLKYYDPEV